MWQKLLSYFVRLLTLVEKTEQNKTEIREIRQELRELTATVQNLSYEIHLLRKEQNHKMEKLALRLENELLKFERRLPSSKHDKGK